MEILIQAVAFYVLLAAIPTFIIYNYARNTWKKGVTFTNALLFIGIPTSLIPVVFLPLLVVLITATPGAGGFIAFGLLLFIIIPGVLIGSIIAGLLVRKGDVLQYYSTIGIIVLYLFSMWALFQPYMGEALLLTYTFLISGLLLIWLILSKKRT